MSHIDRLVELGDKALHHLPEPFTQSVFSCAGTLGWHLSELLWKKNGFYIWHSAFHLFPVGRAGGEMDFETWNSENLWRSDFQDLTTGCCFFAEDIFGGQFCTFQNAIYYFDPETGEKEAVADSLEGWADAVLAEPEFKTGFPLAQEWEQLHGVIPRGMRLVPKIPFVAGGEYNVGNLYLTDAVKGMKSRANIAMQIKDLPDGTKIRFNITP